MAFILPVVPAVNGDRSFRVAASELIGVRRGGLEDTGATMAGDVYAFAVLAWEVRVKFFGLDKPLNGNLSEDRFLLGGLHSPTRALSQELIRCRMDAGRLDLTTVTSLIPCGR